MSKELLNECLQELNKNESYQNADAEVQAERLISLIRLKTNLHKLMHDYDSSSSSNSDISNSNLNAQIPVPALVNILGNTFNGSVNINTGSNP